MGLCLWLPGGLFWICASGLQAQGDEGFLRCRQMQCVLDRNGHCSGHIHTSCSSLRSVSGFSICFHWGMFAVSFLTPVYTRNMAGHFVASWSVQCFRIISTLWNVFFETLRFHASILCSCNGETQNNPLLGSILAIIWWYVIYASECGRWSYNVGNVGNRELILLLCNMVLVRWCCGDGFLTMDREMTCR